MKPLILFLCFVSFCAAAQWTPPGTDATQAATDAQLVAVSNTLAAAIDALPPDTDTHLTETQVDGYVANNGYADAADLSAETSARTAADAALAADIAAATPVNYDAVSTAALSALQSESDPDATPRIDGLTAGTDPFAALQLDRTISSWDDIGVTYTNAVRQNAPVSTPNDATWTGWTTTGDLTGTNIWLTIGETLTSPVQPNGIADYSAEISSAQHATGSLIECIAGSTVVDCPYYGSDGQIRITCGSTMPGAPAGLTISQAVITGYNSTTEAAQIKTVSGLRRIEVETDPSDLTRKTYVDAGDSAAKSYASAALATYGDSNTKTLRGASLRLGNMWVVSPASTDGSRYIVSGGEITGDGELIGTDSEFVISKNDYPLMTFVSDASGLVITNWSVSLDGDTAAVTLNIATNGVESAPFAEWSESLTSPEWHRISTYTAETYPTASAGTYTLSFEVAALDVMYFRAMQPAGQSVATVLADVLDIGSASIVSHGSSGGTNRTATLTYDFDNNYWTTEVTDD